MFDNSWPGWSLAQSAISAGAGLLGVLAGAWMTSRNQRRERLNAHLHRQLQEFYSPMVGMRIEIGAKQKTAEEIQKVARIAVVKDRKTEGRPHQVPFTGDEISAIRQLHVYDSAQWHEQIFPLYEKMLAHFSNNLWLTEASTRIHYGQLVNFVEVWRRQKASPLNLTLSLELDFSDAGLAPLYEDLQMQFDRLTALIRR